MMSSSKRATLIGTVAVLLVAVAALQNYIDPLRRQKAIEPQDNRVFRKIGNQGFTLPFEYALGAVSGFRQVIAGLLWVRADSFFHSGNYDAILPLIRIITWMDPNFLDAYATGAWHLTYNFTDEQQRSDRRYLPAGAALLNEGIRNNSNIYDLYGEAGWLNFDKIKNYDEAVRYYTDAMDPSRNPSLNRVGHALAHSLERAGRIDDAIAQWEKMVAAHQAVVNDPKATDSVKATAMGGVQTATKNLNLMKIRKVSREYDTKSPVDAQFSARVVRLRPKVLEVTGEWNLVGAKNFDEKIWGPVDGARVDVRLHDYGYKMPAPAEFSFDVDNTLTLMQEQISARGGKSVKKGGLYVVNVGGNIGMREDKQGLYAFDSQKKGDVPAGLGVPLGRALAGAATLSAEGRRALEALAEMPLADLRANRAKIADLEKQGYHVALKDYYRLATFRREIDMSKDPKMYSFSKDRYQLILSFNPRTAPEFVQDRYGWNGEGLSDKRFLDTSKPGLRMLRMEIPVTREDLLGDGRKVIYPSQQVGALAR